MAETKVRLSTRAAARRLGVSVAWLRRAHAVSARAPEAGRDLWDEAAIEAWDLAESRRRCAR